LASAVGLASGAAAAAAWAAPSADASSRIIEQIPPLNPGACPAGQLNWR
jgi:hypothetical protein